MNLRGAGDDNQLVVILVRTDFHHERSFYNANRVRVLAGDRFHKFILTLNDRGMYDAVEFLAKRRVAKDQVAEHRTVDASVRGHDARSKGRGDRPIHGLAGLE